MRWDEKVEESRTMSMLLSRRDPGPISQDLVYKVSFNISSENW